METKFTPGPWRAWKDDYAEVHFVGVTDKIVARIWHGYHPEEKANRHLIAAAPELYEALVPFAEAAAIYNEHTPDSVGVTVPLKWLRQARAALKKARGE